MYLYMSKKDRVEVFDGYRAGPVVGVALPITEIARVAIATAVRVTLAIDEVFVKMSDKFLESITDKPKGRARFGKR